MPKKKDINRLKVVLVEKKRSQVWLAQELGRAKQTVSRWCSNTSQPPLEVLVQIAELLDVSVYELIIDNKGKKARE